MRKVLIFTSFFPPEKGAAANRIYNMAAGLQERGVEVEVVCPLANYPTGKIFPEYKGRLSCREVIKGVPVRRYWIYPTVSKNPVMRVIGMLSFSLSILLASLSLRAVRADACIIQGHPMFVSWTAVVISKWILKVRVFLNVSDIWPLSALEMGAISRGRMYSLLEVIESFNYKHSNVVIGQSDGIVEHVKAASPSKEVLLYRNLPRVSGEKGIPQSRGKMAGQLKVVYAGLLGYAQGMAEIVKAIDWDSLGVSLDIYGDGGDRVEIEDYIAPSGVQNVKLHGMVPPEQLNDELPQYHVALVPLVTTIHGAVPSKLYELSRVGMPMLFSGGGEGAELIEKHGLGLTCQPGDFVALNDLLIRYRDMAEEEYRAYLAAGDVVSKSDFDFDTQMDDFVNKVRSF